MKRVVIALLFLLSGCSTAQVSSTCAETQRILQIAQPFLGAAPPEVQLAVTAIGVGVYACNTPEYANMRDYVVGFLKTKGVTKWN